METSRITLADGRELAYITYGARDGVPVLFSHGFGDSRLIRNPDEALTDSLGAWMIAADQPGVGGSSPRPGRTLADWARDTEQLADSLRLDRFTVAGHSGGGPHALAVAAHLGARVTRGVLASPVGPTDLPSYESLVASRELRTVLKLRRFRPLLRGALGAEAWIGARDSGKYLSSMAAMDKSDAPTFYADRAQQAMFEASFAEGIAQGGRGMSDMLEALFRWDFTLADITQPVDLFYGDNDDLLTPGMADAIAQRLPNCTSHVWPGAGHYGFVDRERWSQFLAALVSG